MPTVAKRKAVPKDRARRTHSSAAAANVLFARRYIETSALVAALLESDAAAKESIRAPGKRVTSALTMAEAARAIRRARVDGRITAREERAVLRATLKFARTCYIVGVTEIILARAAHPFPIEPVRTLDAIHLATVDSLGDSLSDVVVVTRDRRILDNVLALGYDVE